METMGTIGVVFGIVAFIWVLHLRERVKRLERIVESNGLQDAETDSLARLLRERVGREVRLSFYQGGWQASGGKYRILDLDGEWVLALAEPDSPKARECLLRLSNIKAVAEKQQ